MIKLEIYVVVCVAAYYAFLKFLSKKKVYQPIYELSPDSHQGKAKTPSFGGVPMLALTGLGFFLIPFHSIYIWIYAAMLAMGGVGFVDDWFAYHGKKNQGLTARQKFFYQCLVSVVVLLSFHALFRPLLLWEWFLYFFLFIGVPNATNLTDGLDGLLTGTTVISLVGFYGLFLGLKLDVGLQFVMIMIVVLMGFLVVNWHPAKQFLGDTGSLSIGALLVCLAMLANNPFILIGFGSVFIIETLSVMIQVFWFKRTKERVFLMSPLHHHFELMGWSEKRVVLTFYLIQFGCVAYALAKLYGF